jgi:uncharacterized membrane protein
LFFLLLPFVASRGLTGHAMAVRDHRALMVLSDTVHMIAVGLWAGGLPVLFWALWAGKATPQTPARAARLMQRFSRVALLSVCLLVPTGVYQSLTHLGELHYLVDSPYGNVLSLKLLLFALMLLCGALNRFYTKPMLLRAATNNSASDVGAKLFSRIGWEGALGVAVLLTTGVLTTLPPGIHSEHLRSQPEPGAGAPMHSHAPAPVVQAAPAEGAAVKILTPKEHQVFKGDRIPLKFSFQKGQRGHHVHAYIDGELMGMFESAEGTLSGIQPGSHILQLRVVADDHQTELDAGDSIRFIVE